MIKKLFSRALLSLIMDKRARSKFKIVRGQKRRLNDIGQSINQLSIIPKGEEMAEKSNSQTTLGLVDTWKKQPAPAPPRQSNYNLEPAVTEISTQKASKIAKQSFTKSYKRPVNKKRKALIEKAMSMRKAKSHILDQLDPKQLRKLSDMVGKAFDQSAAE